MDNFEKSYFIKSNPSKHKLNNLLKYIKKNNITNVILEDYFIGIDNFIKELNKLQLTIKFVWTNGLGTLNEEIELGNLEYVMNLLKNDVINEVAFTEENIYLVFKNTRGVKRLLMTVKDTIKKSDCKCKTVGILGDTYDWRSNLYNQISSIKFLKNYEVSSLNAKRLFKSFCKLFDININNYSDINLFMKNSQAISCVEFSSLYSFEILDAFNNGVPCILGNNVSIFKKTELEDLIVVKSDDDINEIAEKLKYVIKNKNQIIKTYKKIKKEYDLESAKSINKLIGG